MAEAQRSPYPTVDGFVLVGEQLVLVRRKFPPLGWALPGGFVDVGEPLDRAVLREVKEETGLDAELVEQFFTYSDPKRDPRKHTLTTVFLARAEGTPVGADDAAEAKLFPLDALPELVFDHGEICADVIRYLRTGARRRL